MSINNPSSALQRWKIIRNDLIRAIDSYLDASTELCNTLSSCMQSSVPRSLLEQALSSLNLELDSLQLDEDRLKGARIAICRERNKAHSVIPIHKLPHEILVVIFMFSNTRFVCGRSYAGTNKVPPTVLAGVCTSWRQLALRTPSIWSHIEVVIGGISATKRYNQAALWTERSKQLPLYMEIYDFVDRAQDYIMSWGQVSALTRFLTPLMPRVYALDINILSVQSSFAVSPVLECWVRSGSTITDKTLEIIYHTDEDSPVLGPPGQVSAEAFNAFFQSIRKVTFCNCRISELVSFHAGLVELFLQRPENLDSYTQKHLCAMLSATPQLRKLSLTDCFIEPSGVNPPPVTLSCLDYLCIESCDNSFNLVDILPMINVTSPSLDLILTLDDDPELIDTVHEFCGRTRVTRLLVKNIQHGPSKGPSLRAILCPMAHLETLAIEGFEIFDDVFHNFLDTFDADRNQAPWPRIHTLHLRHTHIDMRCLQRLAFFRSLQNLYLHCSHIAQRSEQEIEDKELEGLMYMVVNFKVYSTVQWAVDEWDFSVIS